MSFGSETHTSGASYQTVFRVKISPYLALARLRRSVGRTIHSTVWRTAGVLGPGGRFGTCCRLRALHSRQRERKTGAARFVWRRRAGLEDELSRHSSCELRSDRQSKAEAWRGLALTALEAFEDRVALFVGDA